MLRPLSPGGSRVWETLYSQHDSLFADKVRFSSCIGTQAPCVDMLALAIAIAACVCWCPYRS